MHLLVIGLSNKTANLDIREKLFFSETKINQAYSLLNKSPYIFGSVILSTCNRVEIYCGVKDFEKAIESVINFISEFHGLHINDFISHLYIKQCDQAIGHLFKVVSSLDSMVVGEYQVQGQIRNAYIYSFENNFSNTLINKAFQSAIQLGKRIRSETAISEGSVSIGSIATELIMDIFTDKVKVLIIGAGSIADVTAVNLKDKLDCEISVTNRSKENAVSFAQKFDATIINFDDKEGMYKNFDIIIASTSSRDFIITQKHINSIYKKQVYIDLSVPRNIDPTIVNNQNINLYTIEDFDKQLTKNKIKREGAISDVKQLISKESEDYYNWYATQTIIPVMKNIKSELQEISVRTLNSHSTFMNTLTLEQQETVKLILKSSNDKLIRVIMKNLKTVSKQKDLNSIANTLKNTFTTTIP